MSDVHQRMVSILAELPAIGKDTKNQQQGFMYRSHDHVLNALNPLLAKHGVFVVPNVLERITGERHTKSGSVMYEVNLRVEFTFYGAAGDSVTGSAWGEGTDTGDKATNKAMTMAFKNILAQSFAVSTSDTIDSDAHSPEDTVARHVTRGPGPLAPPKSWAKWTEMVSVYDQAVHDAFLGFQLSLIRLLNPESSALTDLTKPDRDYVWQKCAGAAVHLREAFDPGAFPPPTVDDVRAAFAKVLDGQELALEGEE